MARQLPKPAKVGIRKAAAVHAVLMVSRYMARRAARQGQENWVSSMAERAVCQVHPLARRRGLTAASEDMDSQEALRAAPRGIR